MDGFGHQRQRHVERHGAAIAIGEPITERLTQSRQHKRQRLEILDGPFQVERLFKPLFHAGRHQRPRIFAARPSLPHQSFLTEAR